MPTLADQRLLEILDKWLASLELHLKYSSLDDDSYWKIQPWVQHQRPSRWIIDLAKQKALAMRDQVHERIKMGDAKFSDALELMTFLANLVGSQHIERFIPLAETDSELPLQRATPVDATKPVVPMLAAVPAAPLHAAVPAAPIPAPQRQVPPIAATGTREMPAFAAAKPRAPQPTGTARVARSERKAAAAQKPPPKPPARSAANPGSAAQAERPQMSAFARNQVIADAARLLEWGRKWYEIAELIARMADRPSLPEVRRILKDNKPAVDKITGRRN